MIGRTSAIATRATVSAVNQSMAASRRRMTSLSASTINPQFQHGTDNTSNRSIEANPALISRQQQYLSVSRASFSSSAKDKDEGSGGIRGWMSDRQERKEQEKYMEQMTKLSTMEVFTMKDYRDELQEGIEGGGMMTKISFMQTKEIKQAKEIVDVVDKIIEVVGPEATAEDLIQMDRLDRLRVATAANRTLEEIAIMVSQITNMDVMQKTLRKRYLEGKPIPENKDAMQAIVQKDALSVLSKSQKEMMKTRQEANARRMARKRRR